MTSVIQQIKMCYLRSLKGTSRALSLVYINDLPQYVKHSTVRSFADDTLLYVTIANERDCQRMQEDLYNLEQWENEWQMCVHLEKGQVVSISRKKNPIRYTYNIYI